MKTLARFGVILVASMFLSGASFANPDVTPTASSATTSVGAPAAAAPQTSAPSTTATVDPVTVSVQKKAHEVMTNMLAPLSADKANATGAASKEAPTDASKPALPAPSLALPTNQSTLVPNGTTTAPTLAAPPAPAPQTVLPAPASEVAAAPAPSSQPGSETTATAAATPVPVATEPEKQVASTDANSLVPVGRVIWVKGSFIAIRPDLSQRNMQKASVIYAQDTLVTDGKSQAQIAFTDTSLMTFKQSTKFVIKEYAYKPEEKSASGSVGTYVMELVTGGLRTITGLISKANHDDYKLVTPVATIGVRGTEIQVGLANGKMAMSQLAGVACAGNLCTTAGKSLLAEAGGRVQFVSNAVAQQFTGPPLPIEPVKAMLPFTPEEVSGKEISSAMNSLGNTKSTTTGKTDTKEEKGFCIK